MAAHKFSRQRECIREYLWSRTDHPTADMVYRAVRESYPSISLGTVYRNLSMMADEGEILRLDVGDGVDHYDARTAPHYHFRCRVCGCVKDLLDLDVGDIDTLASEMTNDRIEGHNLFFFGVCEDCLKKSGPGGENFSSNN